MQNTAKILIMAAFAVGFGTFANAQSASISANATVVSEIVVANVNNLNFGTVVVGQKKSITAYEVEEVSSGPVLGSANPGRFRVNAQRGSYVSISFDFPTNLLGTGGSQLPIYFSWDAQPDKVIVVTDGDYNEAAPLILGTAYQINNYNALSETPFYEFVIGGQVDATSATAGTYTGTITLSATYN
jgi:spore coat protein U-like protein